jgi:hypothetical protein
MGNCQNSQCRLSGSVNDSKREPGKRQAPIQRLDNYPYIWVLAQQIKRPVHFGLEISAQPREAAFVVPGGINQFLQRSGVKLDSHP